jgi:hypothetical protein
LIFGDGARQPPFRRHCEEQSDEDSMGVDSGQV